jgi:hypothetical protein
MICFTVDSVRNVCDFDEYTERDTLGDQHNSMCICYGIASLEKLVIYHSDGGCVESPFIDNRGYRKQGMMPTSRYETVSQ